jgi:hypothetical protein
MKKQNLISRIRLAAKTALQFWCAHAATRKAMKKIYSRVWDDEKLGEHFQTKIFIVRKGVIYRVTQLFYINGTVRDQQNWIATYGWHSNGHLMAIGSSRYLIFNPTEKVLYLEEWVDGGKTMDIYQQIQ